MDFKAVLLNWEKKLDHDVIDGFRDAISSYSKDRERKLSKEYNSIDISQFDSEFDYESYKSHIENEGAFLGEIEFLRNELVILALYKKIELKRKRILKTAYPYLVEKSLSDFNYIKKNIKFDLSSIDGATGVDEIRLINNSIKHEGKVSSQLSKYPGWKNGDALSGLEKVYERLLPEVKKYFIDLVSKVN